MMGCLSRAARIGFLAVSCSGVALGLSASSARAGAWVPPPGTGYHKLSVNHFASENFSGPSSASRVQSFRNTNINYYGEVGVLPRVALFGTVSLAWINQERQVPPPFFVGVPNDVLERLGLLDPRIDKTDFRGVGDVDLGVRVAILEAPVVVSGQFLFKLPYLYRQNRARELPPGNGQEDFEARLLFGKSLNRWGYAGLEAAYRFRLDAPSDEFRALGEYGFSLTDSIYARTKLELILSVRNGDNLPTGGIGLNPTLATEFDLFRQEFTLGYNFPKLQQGPRFGVEFTYTRDHIARNTLRGNTVQFGITLAH